MRLAMMGSYISQWAIGKMAQGDAIGEESFQRTNHWLLPIIDWFTLVCSIQVSAYNLQL